MNLHRTIVTLGAAALLVAPATAAFAQQGPPPWAQGNNNGQYQRHDRDNDGDRDDRGRGNREHEHHDRGRHNGWNNPHNPHNGQYNNGQYNNGRYGGNNNGQYGQYGRNGNRLSGTVSSFSPFNLYLQNGTHVELHQGTVINPTGATPQPGQRAQIIGHWNADGTFAADQINLY